MCFPAGGSTVPMTLPPHSMINPMPPRGSPRSPRREKARWRSASYAPPEPSPAPPLSSLLALHSGTLVWPFARRPHGALGARIVAPALTLFARLKPAFARRDLSIPCSFSPKPRRATGFYAPAERVRGGVVDRRGRLARPDRRGRAAAIFPDDPTSSGSHSSIPSPRPAATPPRTRSNDQPVGRGTRRHP